MILSVALEEGSEEVRWMELSVGVEAGGWRQDI